MIMNFEFIMVIPVMSFVLVGMPNFGAYEANVVRVDMDAGQDTIYVAGNSRVGIGTASPSQKLQVSGNIRATGHLYADGRVYVDNTTNYLAYPSGNYGSVQINGGGKGGWEGYSINGRYNFMSDDDNTMGLYNDINNRFVLHHERNNFTRLMEPDSATIALHIGANGRVGLGNSNPRARLEVTGTNSASVGGDGVIRAYNTTNNHAADGIDVQLNRTNPGGNNSFVVFRDGSNSVIGHIHGNGGGSITYSYTSDARLKENVVDTTYGLEDLMNLQVRDFNYISAPTKIQTGFVAQELYEFYPSAVTVGGDDATENPWSVGYGDLTPLLTQSIQDLKNEVDEELALLRKENQTLKKRLELLES